ncbi:hypothetical protein AAG747_13255 [Rapidithrix thailandica]|uniref:Tetratricopeptide repeat protein n=1 Tax=Rapidithrix thailandica TaxID=413964 RepID=A0AAW9SC31_9BACT
MVDQAQTYYQSEQYHKAIELLEKELQNSHPSPEIFGLLSRCYLAIGDIIRSEKIAAQGLESYSDSDILQEIYNNSKNQLNQILLAIRQIEDGQHTSAEINFIKANTELLIKNQQFEQAIDQLSLLADARKAKTTNILWIGQYLKEIYFEPAAEVHKHKYTKLLFEEVIFYYLKACKLYEKGYQEIREAAKNAD